MNNKLNEALNKELKRFNAITAYQNNLRIDEVSYRFYNEADEPGEEEMPPMTDTPPAVDNQTDVPAEIPGQTPDVPAEMPPAPEAPIDTPPVDNAEVPMDPNIDPNMGGEEDVTEIDITDLVNTTNEMGVKIDGISTGIAKIDAVMNRVASIEANLSKMDALIGSMEQIAKQVELMRPPTEEERKRALAKDSYPYSVTLDQYNNGEGVKNQTELEGNKKMSMLDNLIADYNESNIKDSFTVPNDDPLTNPNYK